GPVAARRSDPRSRRDVGRRRLLRSRQRARLSLRPTCRRHDSRWRRSIARAVRSRTTPTARAALANHAAGSRSPAAGLALVRAGEEGERRSREDLQVEPGRAVLDVPDVELDPIVPRQACSSVDLRPAGDAGPDVETPALSRRVALDLVRERGAGADEAHVAADDVPQLWQFVDRQAPQE